jgi:MYXO-CTERM domain-containing protein
MKRAATPSRLPANRSASPTVALLALAAFFLLRRRAQPLEAELVLKPGEKVGDAEARQQALDGTTPAAPPEPEPPVLIDPLADIKERARAMVREDRERALLLIRSWLSADLEKSTPMNQFQGGDRA